MRHFFIVAFVLMSVLSFSQRTVKGKVTDESGVPLQGATVFIKSESKGETTDRAGKFVISGLSHSMYQIEVSYVGFETQKLDVNTNVDFNVVLKRAAYQIDEVTVTTIRANDRSAVAYTNVNKEEIAQRNMGQDIPYLLALTPGFVATSDAGTGIGYTGFRIRGTDANRTNITVNGVPLNDAESHGTFFVNMPDFASSLSSMQVQRGVGTSTNGAAAFGASINMETEGLKAKPFAEISSTYGSFNTNKNTLKAGTGLINNKFAFDARLSNVSSDGYIDRAWVDMKSYYFSAGYYGEKSTVKFLTFGGNEKTYQAWNGVDSEIMKTNRTYNELGEYKDNEGNTHYYDNQTDNYAQTHYQLHWLQTLNNHLNFNTTAHLTRGLGYYEDYKTGRKYKEYGLIPDTVASVALKKTDLVRQKWLDNYFYGITYAMNYDKDWLNFSVGGAVNRYDGNHFGKVKWVRNANNLDMSKDWYRNNGVKDDANVYAKLNAETFKNLFASVDLQYRNIHYRMAGTDDKYDEDNNVMRDITQTHEYHFFNPKFGMTYMVDKNNSAYASFSVSNREPNRNNYTERAKNEPEPLAERLYDTEAGYRFQSENVSVGVNMFYMKYKNQLILTGKISEIGEMLTTNIPDSYRTGVELMMGVKPFSWLRWDANVTLSQNKIKNFIEQDVDMYDADWNWIGTRNDTLGTTDNAYSPNVVANSALVLSYYGWELGLFSSFVGKQYFDNTSSNDRAIDAYLLNNLSLKYSLPVPKMRGIDFQLMVNNLLNNKYESNAYTWYSYYLDGQRVNEKRYFPQAGINLLASVTLKF